MESRGPGHFQYVGNFLRINKIGHDRFLEEQIKRFGAVFGYYVGTTPKVAVTDAEIVKEIMVKEFEKFSDRGFLGPPSLIPKALGLQAGMVVSVVDTWRPGRRALTPSFSAMKMKLMVPLLKKSTDILVEILGECVWEECGGFSTIWIIHNGDHDVHCVWSECGCAERRGRQTDRGC